MVVHAAVTPACNDAVAHAKLGGWLNALISVLASVSSYHVSLHQAHETFA